METAAFNLPNNKIADTLKATKELMLKVNSLRQQAGLSAIEN